MTTNEVRVKLGKIVDRVFTQTFAQKYEMIAVQTPGYVASSLIRDHSDNVDAYINLACQHINSVNDLENLSKIANPLVIFALFARYHLITQDFIAADQAEKRILPNDDSAFFKSILIDYWRTTPYNETT